MVFIWMYSHLLKESMPKNFEIDNFGHLILKSLLDRENT